MEGAQYNRSWPYDSFRLVESNISAFISNGALSEQEVSSLYQSTSEHIQRLMNCANDIVQHRAPILERVEKSFLDTIRESVQTHQKREREKEAANALEYVFERLNQRVEDIQSQKHAVERTKRGCEVARSGLTEQKYFMELGNTSLAVSHILTFGTASWISTPVMLAGTVLIRDLEEQIRNLSRRIARLQGEIYRLEDEKSPIVAEIRVNEQRHAHLARLVDELTEVKEVLERTKVRLGREITVKKNAQTSLRKIAIKYELLKIVIENTASSHEVMEEEDFSDLLGRAQKIRSKFERAIFSHQESPS